MMEKIYFEAEDRIPLNKILVYPIHCQYIVLYLVVQVSDAV